VSALIDQWEDVTDAMAQRLVEAWRAMSERIGDRPLWNEQLPEREQARNYQIVRNDPQAWTALMKEHGYLAVADYMLRGERLSKKYPDEEAYGQTAVEGAALMSPPGAPAPAGKPAPPTTPTVSEQRHVMRQPQAVNFSEGQIGASNG